MNSKNKSVITAKDNKKDYKKEICSFVSVRLLGLMNLINHLTKFCFNRSDYAQTVENSVNEMNTDIDVGQKVKAYDREVYDVISEPIRAMHYLKDDMSCIQGKLNDCEVFVFRLYDFYKEKDYENVDKMFLYFMNKHQEEKE